MGFQTRFVVIVTNKICPKFAHGLHLKGKNLHLNAFQCTLLKNAEQLEGIVDA